MSSYESENEVTASYLPSLEEQKAQTQVYKDIEYMIERRNQNYKQFNGHNGDRTAIQYWEDSDRRLNGYTLTREEQGKEDWQANFFDPVTRNKLKAYVGGVATQIPELKYKAVNSRGIFSAKRAELTKQLVRHSYLLNQNPQKEMYDDAWECAGRGTVIKYDGYLKTKEKRKFVTGWNQETGQIESKEEEVIVEDRPIELAVKLEEFFIWNFFIEDVQDQDKLAWIQIYSREKCKREFGKYKNYKYLKDKGGLTRFESETKSYFYDSWSARVDKDAFEVIRFYCKSEDRYEIWINGVPLLQAPLLWGKKKKKYPFAKTILERFESRQFFYGKSLPHILESIQDETNTVKNSVADKLFRSLTPPMLVGLVNKDLLDVEDEFVNQDNKIYVPDINQVKPMPFEGVTNGDMMWLQMLMQDANFAGGDASQGGTAQKDVTARATVIADEHARKLKGVFFMFLEDLWLQKTRLRIPNVLQNYFKPRYEQIIGPEGTKLMSEVLTIINIPNTKLADGKVGMLGIQIANEKSNLLTVPQIEAREKVMEDQGIPYKLVASTSDYLDDWEYDIEVIPESLYAADRMRQEGITKERQQYFATYFPEFFLANKDKFIEEILSLDGQSMDEYNPPVQPPPPEPEGATPLNEGALLAQGA